MSSKKLLLVPAAVISLLVPTMDADAASSKRKNAKGWDQNPPGQARADDNRPVGVGNGRRMR